MTLTVEPLTPARFPDVEALFAARGCSMARQCFCMAYRLSGRKATPYGLDPAGNRRELAALTAAGVEPGLLAYRDGTPVGWLSIGPRADFPRLKRSKAMAAFDDQPVWSIICLTLPSAERGRGVSHALLAGAIRYARERGATILEAYPADDAGRDGPRWFGPTALYAAAGFTTVAERDGGRRVMRLALNSGTW